MAGVGSAHLRPAGEVLLQVVDLHVEYSAGRGRKVRAVSGLSLDVAPGETLGLVGESGCGKSTTARAVLQLPRPTSGTVTFDGIDLTALRGEELRRVRTGLQMIFQDPISSLNPRRRVGDIVREGLDIWPDPPRARPGNHADTTSGDTDTGGTAAAANGRSGNDGPDMADVTDGSDGADTERSRAEVRAAISERVRSVLASVGMDFEEVGDRRPHEFSGGQCQRICIARALALQPRVLICDEPVSSLDVSIQAQILNLLEDLKDRYGLTMLFIAHDLAVVKNISDRVCVMYLGRICEIGPTDAIFDDPAHPYTAALLASIPDPHPPDTAAEAIAPDPPATAADPPDPPAAGAATPDPSGAGAETAETAGDSAALAGDPPSPFDVPSGCRFRTRCGRATDLCAEAVPELRPAPGGRHVACHFPLTETP